MNRRGLFVAAALGALVVVPLVALDARAADPPLASAPAPAAPSAPSAGLAVLALPGAGAPAWSLAQTIYADDALRPASLDEAHARVLAGEPPPAAASRDLVDLAETRAAVRGDDAPSRALLASIANTFHLRGIVVVEMGSAAPPSARVFVAGPGAGAFDAARYEPDPVPSVSSPGAGASGAARWTGATTSLHRAFAASVTVPPAAPATASSSSAPPVSAPLNSAPPNSAPPLATSSVPDAPHETATKGGTPFFKSPWFWGAIGAAAFGTTAIYFATRDNSSSTIHLEMQAPK